MSSEKWHDDDNDLDGSTHLCETAQSGGGVARNMAEALWRLRGGRARLLTAVGDDADGVFLSEIAPGMLLDGCMVRGARTATYAAILDARGECQLGLGDMALHNHISIELVNRHMDILEKAPVVVLDGNAPQSTIEYVIQHCSKINKPGNCDLTLETAMPGGNKYIYVNYPTLRRCRANRVPRIDIDCIVQ